MIFPVPNWISAYPFNTYMRRFGARRDGGRREHAGCDLYAPLASPVLSITNGVVLDTYEFYNKTFAVEVNHGYPIGVIRYGEIKIANGIGRGKTVKAGDVLGNIGILIGAGMNGIHPMCHLEQFSGAASGPLTDRSAKGGKAQRRSDLMDPTSLLLRLQTLDFINGMPRTEEESAQRTDANTFQRISAPDYSRA